MLGKEDQRSASIGGVHETYTTARVEAAIATALDQQPRKVQDANHQLSILGLPKNSLRAILKPIFIDLFFKNAIESVEQGDPVIQIATGKRPLSGKRR